MTRLRTPVILKSSGTSKEHTNDMIVDKDSRLIAKLHCSCATKDYIGPQIVTLLNRSQEIMPTTCVTSDGETFVGRPINAPLTMRSKEHEYPSIVVTFDDEPDISLTWVSPHPSVPWDYRVVEIVAVMDLYCIRADQIYTGTTDKPSALGKISAMLVEAGFKLWA